MNSAGGFAASGSADPHTTLAKSRGACGWAGSFLTRSRIIGTTEWTGSSETFTGQGSAFARTPKSADAACLTRASAAFLPSSVLDERHATILRAISPARRRAPCLPGPGSARPTGAPSSQSLLAHARSSSGDFALRRASAALSIVCSHSELIARISFMLSVSCPRRMPGGNPRIPRRARRPGPSDGRFRFLSEIMLQIPGSREGFHHCFLTRISPSTREKAPVTALAGLADRAYARGWWTFVPSEPRSDDRGQRLQHSRL